MAKDHTVPKTYLRGFASDGTGPPNYRGLKLWVFNKVSGHHSQASIKSVAFEENFESLPLSHPHEAKVMAFADKLHKKEDRWPQLRAGVGLTAERGRTIDRGLRLDLADYMACQFLRTGTFRTLWRAGHEDLLARGVVPTPGRAATRTSPNFLSHLMRISGNRALTMSPRAQVSARRDL